MSEKLLKLKAQIEALSPAARLLLASQIWKTDPDLACLIAERVVQDYQVAKLFSPPSSVPPQDIKG